LDRGASDGCRHTWLVAPKDCYRPSSRGYHHHVVQALARAAGVGEDCGCWRGLRVLARTADAGEDCECWRALQVLASTAGAEKTCGGLKMRRETLFYWLEPPLMGNMYGLAQTGELYPSKSKSLEPWCSTVRAKYERSSVQQPAHMSFLAIGYSWACLVVFCELVKI
jgi:hypothetical protein